MDVLDTRLADRLIPRRLERETGATQSQLQACDLIPALLEAGQGRLRLSHGGMLVTVQWTAEPLAPAGKGQ